MDRVIERNGFQLKKAWLTVAAVAACLLFAFWYSRGDSGGPTVSRDKIRIAEVQRGELDVAVSGTGKIAATDPDWAVATVSGRVAKSRFKAGQAVRKGDILVELSNEDVVSELARSDSEVRAVQEESAALEIDLGLQALEFESEIESVALDLRQEQFVYDAMTRLKQGKDLPISIIDYAKTEMQVNLKSRKLAMLEKKLVQFNNLQKARLEAARFRLASAREENTRLKQRVENLSVKASSDGVIQNVDLTVGQAIEAGEPIAQIVNPESSYVVLEVPASQIYRVKPDQKVKLVINRTIHFGRVHRIDPNVKGTTVSIDVHFEGEVNGQSLGMYVTGDVLVNSLGSTLFVDIPAHAVENGRMQVFKVSPAQDWAEPVTISTGALSTNYMQIIEGLEPGDKIILSDLRSRVKSGAVRLN